MTKETAIKLFNEKQIRTHWDDEQEKWYFSIVDVVGVLSESPNPNNYWKVLKHRLVKEGSELVTNCNQLKMQSTDGKFYKTDVADTEQLFRLIQSIPSPKAEPFKMWLAKVGRERIDEIEDPELGIDRMMETYLRKGYSKEWINQRLKSIEVRKELTDE
ncbi:MAG TPA: Bro-N domain-containing protein, partial [Prolixibacteraceae bacterium]|nr:Bro-N domain-containing protein [Prolixibacteraceae bacterium]